MNVPSKIEKILPFKTAEKVRESRKSTIAKVEHQNIPSLLQDTKEKEVSALIQRLNAIKHMKSDKKDEKYK